MADDKMRNEDQRNMGGQGQEGGSEGRGQQTPGRNPQDDQSTGQRQGTGNEPNDDMDEGQGGARNDQGGQRR